MPKLLRTKIFAILIFSLIVTACDNNRHLQDLKQYADKLTQAEKSPSKTSHLPPLQPIKAPVAATYQANHVRTPFETTERTTSTTTLNNPLQTYPLNMLRFIGTLTKNNVTFAYILTPDNKIYQVKNADSLGNHAGKISKIFSDHIEIIEKDFSDADHPTQSLVKLQLKD